MNKIYDTESDQLKCSFCTSYFKCSLHFAGLQRYALKACPKCLHNFSYSLLHPHSFQLYRLFLLDTGIALPPKPLGDHLPTASTELHKAADDLNAKISLYYEDRIAVLMREMENVKENLQLTIRKIEENYNDVFTTNSEDSNSRTSEVKEIIQKLQRYEVSGVGAEGRELVKSTRKSPMRWLDKENIQSSNCSNVSKLLKSKICGTSSSRALASSSNSKLLSSSSNYKLLTPSRAQGFSKSRLSRSMLKSAEAEAGGAASRFGEQERAEVARLLEQRLPFESYMPRGVSKQWNVCLKSEGSRNLVESVLELRSRTARTEHIVELIGGDASKTNFGCYLRSLRELGGVKTVRMIGCSLVDADMDQLLHLLAQMPEVETLIVTNNRLTDLSVEALAAFRQRHPRSRLSSAYLGNNHIASRAFRRENREGQLSIHF